MMIDRAHSSIFCKKKKISFSNDIKSNLHLVITSIKNLTINKYHAIKTSGTNG